MWTPYTAIKQSRHIKPQKNSAFHSLSQIVAIILPPRGMILVFGDICHNYWVETSREAGDKQPAMPRTQTIPEC